MPKHKLYLSEEKDIIICKIIGDITYQRSKQLIKEIAGVSIQTGIHLLFVDVRESDNRASVFENYATAYSDMKAFKDPLKWRIAALKKADNTTHKFMRTVTRNAGYQLEAFTDKDKAFKWLRSSKLPERR